MVKKVKKYKNIKPNNEEKGLLTKKSAKKIKRARKANKAITLALVFVLPIILVFFEALIRSDSTLSAISWMGQNISICVVNCIFILCMYTLLQIIINKAFISSLITEFIYLIFPIISKLKLDIRGEVLLINELGQAKNLGEITGMVEIQDAVLLKIILISLFVIFITAFIYVRKIKTFRKTSIVFSTLLVSALLLILVIPATSKKILLNWGINNNLRFSANIIHEKQGTWMGLYSNYVMNKVSPPAGYSRQTIFNILKNVDSEENKTEPSSSVKPTVIMIMNESFFDPTSIPNIEYTTDPMPNVRKLLEKYESGTMISSTFAGGTANVEFEAFTGEATEFLPYGIVPYMDLTKNLANIKTIQKEFKNNGYKTVALHNYDGTFYERDKAYKEIGFDEFKDSSDMEPVSYYGKYISDATIYEHIIKQFESSDEPQFIWGLTMQNHTPYQTANFTEGFDKVKLVDSDLSPEAEDKLMAYVNEVYESDLQIKRLIDYLDNSKKPVVLLFYGDHLPSLYDVYEETGMISTKNTINWTSTDMYKMHKIPFFIYDNFSNEEKKHDNIVGATFLGNKLLNYVGIEKSIYFKFLDSLEYRALRDRLFVDKDGRIYSQITKECEKDASNHKMLEYDMMYGENYIAEYEKNVK